MGYEIRDTGFVVRDGGRRFLLAAGKLCAAAKTGLSRCEFRDLKYIRHYVVDDVQS